MQEARKKILLKALAVTGLKFKSTALFEEFTDQKRTDPRVRMLALELGLVARLNNFKLVITSISRSSESNINIYGYDKVSGHRELPARAIDISTKNLSTENILRLQNHFSAFLDQGDLWSLIHHNVGHGDHLHLQVPHEDYNKILWENS